MNKNSALIVEASRWVNVHEFGGDNQGEFITMFQRLIGRASGEPWCMSFIQYDCYWVDQYFPETTHKLYPSEHCMTVWDKTPAECRLLLPIKGSVAIWRMGDTQAGHAGIVTGVGKTHMFTIEGNTSDNKGKTTDGDGVFVKRRLLQRSSKSKMQLEGFLNPWP